MKRGVERHERELNPNPRQIKHCMVNSRLHILWREHISGRAGLRCYDEVLLPFSGGISDSGTGKLPSYRR